MITIEINGQQLETESGSTIIEVADSAGIYIPRFCYHKKLSVAANCRMCLVEVEKAPKALPACATPVSDGMVVRTASEKAEQAQRDTMEFLLINHPLDCPICDQGGECPLQDQAVGYGGDSSVFNETKRSVEDSDIGPLIATEMTRCIHCTLCVRFGQELAGIMEFGVTGRGEDMKIETFLGGAVSSEVSGNVIDLCPVGALTSKPYRFTARPWELTGHDGISPHDCLGSNLEIQEVGGVVKRILPRENEAVNECWLSDRDRYSYESANTNDRLTMPLMRRGGSLQQVEWQDALESAAAGILRIKLESGGDQIGALSTPTATLEEFFLLQKILRGLGSSNIDHRLRQQDFRDDFEAPLFPGTETAVSAIQDLDRVLLVGCNIRKELPLLSLRLRRMVEQGGAVGVLNPMRFEHNFPTVQEIVIKPSLMPAIFAKIARHLAVGRQKQDHLPGALTLLAETIDDEPQHVAIANMLADANQEALIILGQISMNHPDASILRSIASWIGDHCGLNVALIPDANGAAGWLSGCVPHRISNGGRVDIPGLNAREMAEKRLRAYLLYGFEATCDYANSPALEAALDDAELVVSFASFRSAVPSQADVVLPVALFTEIEGSYVNCEGRLQRSAAAVRPLGDARPGWKILRVLGNLLTLDGFDYVNVGDVTHEVHEFTGSAETRYRPQVEYRVENPVIRTAEQTPNRLDRIIDVPIYAVDPLVRRATALQLTADAGAAAVHVGPDVLSTGLKDGDTVRVTCAVGAVNLPVRLDHRVPTGAAYVPVGYSKTAGLGSSFQVALKTILN